MIAIDRELTTSTSNNVIAATNIGVDATANDVKIPTLKSTIDCRSENVDELTTGSASD